VGSRAYDSHRGLPGITLGDPGLFVSMKRFYKSVKCRREVSFSADIGRVMEGIPIVIPVCAGTVKSSGLDNKIRGGTAIRTGLGLYQITMDQELNHFDGVFIFSPTAPGIDPINETHFAVHWHIDNRNVGIAMVKKEGALEDAGFHFLFARIPHTQD